MLEKQHFKQLDFKSKFHSPMERLLAVDQIRYHKPIKIIKLFFEFYMQLRPQAPIRIYTNYPIGYFAQVLSEDKVWTVECRRGELILLRVADFVGYTPNGSYITAAEEDISDNMYYRYYSQCCNYAGSKNEAILCRDFCDDGDYDEYQCRCCPYVKQQLDF